MLFFSWISRHHLHTVFPTISFFPPPLVLAFCIGIHPRYVKKLMLVRGGGEHCVLATRTDDQSGQFILILCNAIGSPVDSKYIDVEPTHLSMTDQARCGLTKFQSSFILGLKNIKNQNF